MSTLGYSLGNEGFSVYFDVKDATILCRRILITGYCEEDICEACIDETYRINSLAEAEHNVYDVEPFIAVSGCTCSKENIRFGYRLMIVTIPDKNVKPQDSLYTILYSEAKSIKNSDFMEQLALLTLPNIEVCSVQKTMDSFDDATCATIKKFNDGFKTKKDPIVMFYGSGKNYQFMTHFQSIFESILTQKPPPITKKNTHIGLKKKMTK
jgi:hypothetical protein